MPGFELIGKKELSELSILFKKSKTLSRMGFENKRQNIFKVAEFEKKFSKYLKTNYTLAVTSGTAALRVALATLNLKPKDEIIAPAFTFVATVEAIVESGAQPIIAEIDETLNMCTKDLLKKITKNTKAVIVVHMLGVPSDLDPIKKICKKNKIKLIEDTAWGLGGSYKNKKLGTHGDIGAFSFDFAKTLTTGEGGMLCFKNKSIFQKACAWHDHGHENNPKVPRWEDTRTDSGFNFRMNEMQGAVGIAQLKKIHFIIKKQRNNYYRIKKEISSIEDIEFRHYPGGSYVSADALIFLMPSKLKAIKCRKELLKQKISTKILPEATTWHFAGHWQHIKKIKKKYSNLKKAFPKSKSILERAVSIPIFLKMENRFAKKVKKSILNSL